MYRYARRYFISALHGSGVGKLCHAIDEAYAAANKELSTSKLAKPLKATNDHQPPLVGGRRVKCRYAHLGGHNPLLIVVHGKQVESLPGSYKRYLAKFFRSHFDLERANAVYFKNVIALMIATAKRVDILHILQFSRLLCLST